jgi:hypothetical protein
MPEQPEVSEQEKAPAWHLRWPGLLLGRVETIDGTLVFPIEGAGDKHGWDEADLDAARRAYPDEPVRLTDDGLLILVGPGAAAMAAMLRMAANL